MGEMDVDTLLTRQMELHTTTRRPPKTAEQLAQLRDGMRDFKRFFDRLKVLSNDLSSTPETVFQCLMFISVGGAVSFDQQHQDGSVPMHQAKVLAREGAIELEPAMREKVPLEELMVFVGICKDIRTSLRVKMEDGNDLVTAEKSVMDAVEYLNFIDAKSKGDERQMFAFYMVEDAPSLLAMLIEADQEGEWAAASLTLSTATMSASATAGEDPGPAEPLPNLVEDELLPAVEEKCRLATDISLQAGKRLRVANTLLDWLTTMDLEAFITFAPQLATTTADTLCKLCTEKRSAICRVGCDAMCMFIQRLSLEANFMDEVANPAVAPVFGRVLRQWAAALTRGVFVTVSAISTATDRALREVVMESHGHREVVAAVMEALETGTQTELRRKCLGYLALALAAAAAIQQTHVDELARLVAPVATKFLNLGDSPIRKMARALCAAVRLLTAVPIEVSDEKTQRLIDLEQKQVADAIRSPRDLEHILFRTNNFVSSLRPRSGPIGAKQYRDSMSSFSCEARMPGPPRGCRVKGEGFGSKCPLPLHPVELGSIASPTKEPTKEEEIRSGILLLSPPKSQKKSAMAVRHLPPLTEKPSAENNYVPSPVARSPVAPHSSRRQSCQLRMEHTRLVPLSLRPARESSPQLASSVEDLLTPRTKSLSLQKKIDENRHRMAL